MVKTILGEAFEQLEQIPKQVVKQTVKLPVDLVKTAAGQPPRGGKQIDPLTGIEIPSRKKLQKLKKQEKKAKATGIPQARQLLSQTAPPPTGGQLPTYITGKPGFSLEKLEQKKKKPELPPPVSAAKPKWGTAERKLGISG